MHVAKSKKRVRFSVEEAEVATGSELSATRRAEGAPNTEAAPACVQVSESMSCRMQVVLPCGTFYCTVTLPH